MARMVEGATTRISTMSKKEKPQRDNPSGSSPVKRIAIVGLPNTGKSGVLGNMSKNIRERSRTVIFCERTEKGKEII